jgi:uncharacterized protein
MLIGLLAEDARLSMLDRKELESFLSMNDLQQNDQMDNVVNIGTRLGLSVVVFGSVEKRGSMITVLAKAIQVGQKKLMFNTRAVAVGEAALGGEMRKLSQQIRTAVAEQLAKEKSAEGGTFGGPAGFAKRSGNRSIHLLWEAPPGAAVAGYEIFRAAAEEGPFSMLSQVARTEYVDETVAKDTPYYYKVRAYNDRGMQSEFSPVINARTAVTPNPPVILKAEAHVKAISLIWSPGPGGGDPLKLKGYRLYRAKSEQGPYREIASLQPANGDSLNPFDRTTKVTYLDKGLGDGEEYHYRVTAFNEKELESEFSRSVKGTTTPAVGAVDAVGELIREVRLSWKPVGSPFIRGYNVYRGPADGETLVRIKRVEAPSDLNRKVEFADRDGLADLTRYKYRITAVEEGETETSPSPPAYAVTRGKPPMAEEFRAAGGRVKQIDLAWKAATAEEVEGYKLYAAKEKETEMTLLKTIPGRQTDRYTDNSRGLYDKLEDGMTYRYRLTTFNRVQVESDAAPEVTARTKPRPQKVSGLRGEGAKPKSVPLSWSPNPEKDIVQYHLFRAAEGGDFERIAKPRENSYLDQGLKDNTLYRYRIQAEDKDGLLSEDSEIASVRTKGRPSRPEGATGGVDAGKTILTWKAAAEPDVVQYMVYEKKLFGVEKITPVREARFSEDAPPRGKSKTYVITAADGSGLESDPCPEVTVTTP